MHWIDTYVNFGDGNRKNTSIHVELAFHVASQKVWAPLKAALKLLPSISLRNAGENVLHRGLDLTNFAYLWDA